MLGLVEKSMLAEKMTRIITSHERTPYPGIDQSEALTEYFLSLDEFVFVADIKTVCSIANDI